MKKIMVTALVLLPLAMQAQDIFTVKATVGHDSAPAKAYLLYKNGKEIVTDSAVITKGAFQFTGAIPGPTLARIIVDHKGDGWMKVNAQSDMTMMYLEKGVIRLISADSLKRAVITGSVANTEYKQYKAFMAGADSEMTAINAQYSAAYRQTPRDEALVKAILAKKDTVDNRYTARQYAFVKANPDAYVSLITLAEAAGSLVDVPTAEPVFNSLSARLRESPFGQEFKALMDKRRAVAVGQPAPAFTQNDVNDHPVKLSDFKGKYVLIDFWASWCKPCRAENPTVVKAYHQYKDRDFTVISVSLDRPGRKEDWVKAIQADGLEWTQVSDLQFWNNEVAKLYGVHSVPQNFLLDKEGKIVAANLRGEELGKTLEKVLN